MKHEHHLFYSDTIDNNLITLDYNEKNHAVNVLRLSVGDMLQVTDANGYIYDCKCISINKNSFSCNVVNKTSIPKIETQLTLLVGLPDKENFETILENVTALGVARIVPVVLDHCRKPWWQFWEKSRERFVAKMIVAMKQSLYPYIPQLDPPATLAEIIDTCDKPIIVADRDGKKISDANAEISAHKKLSCLIGPPGGLSSNEIKILKPQETIFVNIAPTRLRTELAATVLCGRVVSA